MGLARTLVLLATVTDKLAVAVPGWTPEINTMAQASGSGSLAIPDPSHLSTLEPPDCLCCQQTRFAMERYCKSQMPMGDLGLEHFDCSSEVGMEVTLSASKGWSSVASCQASCQRNLDELKSLGCPMACKRLPFACPSCAPPPAPPPPCGATCSPVPKNCCEAVLKSLEKFCYSFNPAGEARKLPDSTHWDGGMWKAPASFDQLCEEYEPTECTASDCGKAPCPKLLSLVARQYHPHICDAVKQCGDFCDNQCPIGSMQGNWTGSPTPTPLATRVQELQGAASAVVAALAAKMK